MPVDRPERPLLDSDPPFLREPSRSVPPPPAATPVADRLQDALDRWRIGVVSFLVPAVLVVAAAAWVIGRNDARPESAMDDPGADPSAVEALVAGVDGPPRQAVDDDSQARTSPSTSPRSGTGDAAGDTPVDGADTGAGATAGSGDPDAHRAAPADVPTDGEAVGADGSGEAPAAQSPSTAAPTTAAPTTTAPTTAAPTTAAPTTAAPTTAAPTTAAPTTAAPTTAAPTTPAAAAAAPADDLGRCVLTVRWRTKARTEPSADADEVGRVGGFYGALAISGSGDDRWYQISTRRTNGWVPADRVRSTWGECG